MNCFTDGDLFGYDDAGVFPPLGQILQMQGDVVRGIEAEQRAILCGGVGLLLGIGKPASVGLAYVQNIVAVASQCWRYAFVNVLVNVQADKQGGLGVHSAGLAGGVQHAAGIHLHTKTLQEYRQFIGLDIGFYLGLVIVVVTQRIVQLGRRQANVAGKDFRRGITHLMIPDQYLDRNARPLYYGPSATDTGGSGDMRMVGRDFGGQAELHNLLLGQTKRTCGSQNAVLVSCLYNYRCTHRCLLQSDI